MATLKTADNRSHPDRWSAYTRTVQDNWHPRTIELQATVQACAIEPHMTVVEFGTGGGSLTRLLEPQCVVGQLITSDVTSAGLHNLHAFAPTTTGILLDPSKPLWWSGSERLRNKVDRFVTLATLHHADNYAPHDSGETNRLAVLKAALEFLVPGGRAVFTDVLDHTPTQAYFDRLHASGYLPGGHPHRFFAREQFDQILTSLGYADILTQYLDTPWSFTSRDEAMHFVHKLHAATCKPEESLQLAEEVLGSLKEVDEGIYQLNWGLGLTTAHKPK